VFNVEGGELLLILVLALFLFGGRLPEVARDFGRTVGNLKRSLAEGARPLTEAGAEVEREAAARVEGKDAGPAPGPAPPAAGPPGPPRA
jgi:TatA/E family protein of Tat protein translocase